MNKNELIKDMRQQTGSGFITRVKLAEYLGVKSPKSVDRYIDPLERIDGKYYFIPDVVEVMLSCKAVRTDV